MTARIVCTRPVHPTARPDLEALGQVVVVDDLNSPASLASHVLDASVIVARDPVPASAIRGATNLRALLRHGAGVDILPVAEATKAGVLVTNAPGLNAQSVAEYVVFATLALLRSFRRMDHDLRSYGWDRGRAHGLGARELSGITMGLVGLGHVGRAIAGMVVGGFGTNVVAHDPGVSDAPTNVTLVTFDDIVATSDVLVVCCPLTDTTAGLIDRRVLDRMRDDALLINAARGPIVDEQAVVDALEEGAIAGAALDVFSQEPLPADSPLLTVKPLLLTPHVAAGTVDSDVRVGAHVVRQAASVLAGDVPESVVNPKALDLYQARFGQRQVRG